MLLLTREQIARLFSEVDNRHPGASEIFVSGEGGDVLVTLLTEDGEPFYKFDLSLDGEISNEKEL